MTISARIAAIPTEPTPTIVMQRFGSEPAVTNRMAKPRSGKAGISGSRLSMSASHLVSGIGIEGAEPLIKAQDERQAYRDFRCCQRQNEDEHDLTVGLSPARAGGDESQPGGIQHDLDGHQH